MSATRRGVGSGQSAWVVGLLLAGISCSGKTAGRGPGVPPGDDVAAKARGQAQAPVERQAVADASPRPASEGERPADERTGDGAPSKPATEEPEPLYTQTGADPSFKSLLDDKIVPVGRNSTDGVKGSVIDVNNALVERGPNGRNPVPRDIRIHTLCNSAVPRRDFPKWTRWYQEDGNTQVFRLFEGEHNVRNSRENAARVEAFSSLKWQRGEWHEWEGTYTIVKPHGCSIFQAKNNRNDWSVMINLSDSGDIKLNHRRHKEDVVIAREMTGKSFDLKVRDNGREYEVYLDGRKVGEGHYDRPDGHTGFRWGMYVGGKTLVKHDAMIFVTGAKYR